MDIAATTATLALGAQAPSEKNGLADKTKLSAAAKQFEAIFVRQMLAEARKAKPAGEDSLFSGQAMDTFNQMQDERFAAIASERGAFGLAKAIEAQLSAQVTNASGTKG
ncbi:rod-binding protein [Novosphingobium flavum]|uniref:Rod-binding protein n=1 Tax=Novosphingobium flavum TaxID=1778672 RepID=A0A7X1FRG1_9SPHN|nr:rod-binding protein [Novosphingobium flavum]MBC2665615.1 rod-binding protein [Novosphingobium flavum]